MELVVCNGHFKFGSRILIVETENTVSAPCCVYYGIIEDVVIKAEVLRCEGTSGQFVTDCYRIGLSVAVNHAVLHDYLLTLFSRTGSARAESGIGIIVTENSAGGFCKIHSVDGYVFKIFLEEVATVLCSSHVFENNSVGIGSQILRVHEYRRRIRKDEVLYIRKGFTVGLCSICAARTVGYRRAYVIVLKLNMQA